jgi:NADPH2:quinone reductase
VLGCPTVISTVEDPSLRPPRLAKIIEWARAGTLRPHISHVWPLADYKTAMRAKWRGEVIGGCALQI